MAECNNYTGLQINPTPSSIGNQYAGVSTDEKPANAPTYSVYLELDTGKFYYYDGTEWKEVPCCGDGGGGGGGGDFSTAQATIVNNAETNFTLTLPYIYDGRLYTAIDSEDIGSELTVTIPLYRGVLAEPMAFNSETAGAFNVSITGNYENFDIKGDCTITISNY